MLKKKYIKSRHVFKVTFELAERELPGDLEVDSVQLLGDFNNWEPGATPMKSLKRGAYQASLELAPEQEYQFRYLVNGMHWYNDSQADAYIPSGFGPENSVLSTANGNGILA